MRKITYSEYKRRIFNDCLLEGISTLHAAILNDASDANISKSADKMCKSFFNDALKLDMSTISTTKKNLAESSTYMKDLLSLCESIAECKAKDAAEENLDLMDSQKIEISPEEKELLDKLQVDKEPELQIDKVRDATVNALIAEDKKAQEIKDSITIAQNRAEEKKDATILKETVDRLNSRGPTSLMNAIMNNVSVAAVKDVSNNGNFVNVSTVMKENADLIKTRSAMIFTLYEMASVFGICKYKPADIKRISEEIYYNK